MAGHSKFKNIMHRKSAQDQKRAKIFSKLGREITVAAKSGMPDPEMNPRLRTAIAAAKAANMPNDRIKKAIDSGSPGGDSQDYDAIRYEGYGPGGVAIMAEALTDNKNRTAAEIRAAFNKHGGTLGETNSVSFMFDHLGYIVYPLTVGDADTMFESAVEAGADNVESGEDYHEITTSVDSFAAVREILEKQFGTPEQAELIWQAKNVMAPGKDVTETILKLIDALEDNDDVQSVFATLDFEATES